MRVSPGGGGEARRRRESTSKPKVNTMVAEWRRCVETVEEAMNFENLRGRANGSRRQQRERERSQKGQERRKLIRATGSLGGEASNSISRLVMREEGLSIELKYVY